jgi:hypothetical protein
MVSEPTQKYFLKKLYFFQIVVTIGRRELNKLCEKLIG